MITTLKRIQEHPDATEDRIDLIRYALKIPDSTKVSNRAINLLNLAKKCDLNTALWALRTVPVTEGTEKALRLFSFKCLEITLSTVLNRNSLSINETLLLELCRETLTDPPAIAAYKAGTAAKFWQGKSDAVIFEFAEMCERAQFFDQTPISQRGNTCQSESA